MSVISEDQINTAIRQASGLITGHLNKLRPRGVAFNNAIKLFLERNMVGNSEIVALIGTVVGSNLTRETVTKSLSSLSPIVRRFIEPLEGISYLNIKFFFQELGRFWVALIIGLLRASNNPEDKRELMASVPVELAEIYEKSLNKGKTLPASPDRNTPSQVEIRGIVLWWKLNPMCENKCGKSADMICGRCSVVAYCSKECQTADWPTHKRECKELSTQINAVRRTLAGERGAGGGAGGAPRKRTRKQRYSRRRR